ncbi:MAG: regulatory protein RecX [Thermodesulfobacteriota bacterium]
MKDTKKDNALAAALRLLYYRDRSISAMEAKLSEKGFSAGEITVAIDTLTGEGLLNDRRFAGELAASRLKNKNWGPLKIALDLRRKGIPAEIAESVISEIDEETVVLSAKRALNKWLDKKGLDKKGLSEKEFASAYRHMEARGFARGLVLRLISPLREPGIVE